MQLSRVFFGHKKTRPINGTGDNPVVPPLLAAARPALPVTGRLATSSYLLSGNGESTGKSYGQLLPFGLRSRVCFCSCRRTSLAPSLARLYQANCLLFPIITLWAFLL